MSEQTIQTGLDAFSIAMGANLNTWKLETGLNFPPREALMNRPTSADRLQVMSGQAESMDTRPNVP